MLLIEQVVEKTAKQKIIAIDILRAIAALGVFYYHTQLMPCHYFFF
jgi:peptidoglycan/LPS O-acetylase OafA/YrhL